MGRLAGFGSCKLTGPISGELHAADLAWLVSSSRHVALLGLRRVTMIVNHGRLVAFLFAVLTLLQTFIDFVPFQFPLWFALAVMRLHQDSRRCRWPGQPQPLPADWGRA